MLKPTEESGNKKHRGDSCRLLSSLTFLAPLWMEQFLQDTFLLSQWSAAPQVRHRSGSHSLTAR